MTKEQYVSGGGDGAAARRGDCPESEWKLDGVTTGYLKMSFDGSTWTRSLEGTLQVSDLTASGKMLEAVHFPFSPDMALTAELKYSKPYKSWYLSGSHFYTVDVSGDIATLSVPGGRLPMRIPEGFVQFYVADAGAVEGGASLSVSGVAPVVKGADGDPALQTGPFGAALYGYAYGGGYVFSGMLHDDWAGEAKDYSFRLVKGLECKAATATGKTLKDIGTQSRAANITGLTWTDDVLKAVPMYKDTEGNVYYFASMNVGATAATDYGAYFAWGLDFDGSGQTVSGGNRCVGVPVRPLQKR